MGCMESLAPVAGAAIGGYFGGPAGAAIGGQIGGSLAAGGTQQGAAGDAADLMKPYSGLGERAANAMHSMSFGNEASREQGRQKYYNSPEYQFGQNAMQQGARNLGFGLSAMGKNPVGADGSMRHGAGMNQYLSGMNRIGMQNFGAFSNRMSGYMDQGVRAGGYQGAAGMAGATAMGTGIAGATNALGDYIQTPQTAQPWINPDTGTGSTYGAPSYGGSGYNPGSSMGGFYT